MVFPVNARRRPQSPAPHFPIHILDFRNLIKEPVVLNAKPPVPTYETIDFLGVMEQYLSPKHFALEL